MKDIKELFNQINLAQEQAQDLQSELLEMQAEGETGAGLVKVGMTGQRRVYSVTIDESVMDDREMLEDLIAGAVNEAIRKIEDMHREKFTSAAGKIDLPSIANLLG